MISIIIPIKDGHVSDLCQSTIDIVEENIPTAQIIVVNSGKPFSPTKSRVLVSEIQTNSRAQRINHGIDLAKNEMIILLHPRSALSLEGLNYIINNGKELTWGAFTHKFDKENPLLKFTSWYSNNVRGKIREIYYLDHCLYIRKSLLTKIGGLPDLDIFEDTALCERLRKESSSKLLPFVSTTSAVRFSKNGMLKQSILNQVLKLCYMLKLNNEQMNKVYEYGIELNSKY